MRKNTTGILRHSCSINNASSELFSTLNTGNYMYRKRAQAKPVRPSAKSLLRRRRFGAESCRRSIIAGGENGCKFSVSITFFHLFLAVKISSCRGTSAKRTSGLNELSRAECRHNRTRTRLIILKLEL